MIYDHPDCAPRRLFPVALRLELMRIAAGIPRTEFERMSVAEFAARHAAARGRATS